MLKAGLLCSTLPFIVDRAAISLWGQGFMYNRTFMLTVKAVTLINISGRCSVIHMLKKGNYLAKS